MTDRYAALASLGATFIILPVAFWSVGFVPGRSDHSLGRPVPLYADGLHNVFRVTSRIYSGSSPDDDRGFASLREFGIRTILTVDGAAPDVRRARAFGFRYIHIPIGYDGIPQDKAWAIVKAVRELPGPIYMHCHHGQHRGPAAVACAMLALDPSLPSSAADHWLKTAGIDPKYTGLTAVPRTFVRPTRHELASLPTDFPSTAPVPDFTRLMIAVDERFDHLKSSRAAGWTSSPGHPDVAPRHEATQLVELYREAARMPETTGRGVQFVALLHEAEARATDLEHALSAIPVNTLTAATAMDLSQATCSQCHVQFRN